MLAVHEISKVMIMAIGFTAQIFFSLRTLFQWWKSEKAKKVVSPSAYWVLSVIGSYLFFVYGILRDDFSIVLGQLISPISSSRKVSSPTIRILITAFCLAEPLFRSKVFGQLISYYIYLWNLNAKGVWKRLGLVLQTVLLATPVVAVVLMLQNASVYFHNFFRNDNIPFWLVVFGSAGQVIFTLRFVYQYFYSRYKHQSTLPVGFWAISLFGSSVIIAYGIFRLDPVLILGQSFGFVAYIRNLVIGFKEKKSDEK